MKNKWRDTKNDATATESSFLDPQAYVDLLNKKRVEAGLKTLKLDTKLSRSASFSAEAILKYNDSSYEATISGYPRSRSMADAGYYNIISGEHNIW